MKKTKSAARVTAPVTAQHALEMLASAVSYCQQAGMLVRMGNTPNLVLSVDGAVIRDGNLVEADVTALTALTPEVTA
jgi:hypothetical protein